MAAEEAKLNAPMGRMVGDIGAAMTNCRNALHSRLRSAP